MITKEDLKQLEERLTKLIEQKFGNTEQLKETQISELMHLYYKDINDKLKNLVHSPNKGFMAGAEIKPKPIWETHPDWESCRTERRRWKWYGEQHKVDETHNPNNACLSISEALAKRQVAEIKLMEIAEKWNEGLDAKGYLYTVEKIFSGLSSLVIVSEYKENHLIYFNSRELADKSIELHKELWEQYFMI